MPHLNTVTNEAKFNDADDYGCVEIEMRKLDETFSDSQLISTWDLCCVRNSEEIKIDRGVLQIEEDQAISLSCIDVALRNINIVQELYGIETPGTGWMFESDIVDGKLSAVRWVVGEKRKLNS